MSTSIEQQIGRVVGVGAQTNGPSGLPAGLTGAPLSAAEDALGVKMSVTRHDHAVSAASAIHDVYAQSTKRLLENF